MKKKQNKCLTVEIEDARSSWTRYVTTVIYVEKGDGESL